MIVVLTLTIVRMVGGTKTTFTVIPGTPADGIDFAPGERSPEEVQAVSDAMPSEWCSYEGLTPPLRLKIRGQSQENYTRITRQHLDAVGRDAFEFLPDAQKGAFLQRISLVAYVVDWEGACYPNGAPLAFSLDNLAALVAKDELLRAFVMENAHRLSPPWPSP